MLAPRPYELLTRPTKQPRPRNEPEDVGGGRTGSQYAIQERQAGSGQTKLGNGREGRQGKRGGRGQDEIEHVRERRGSADGSRFRLAEREGSCSELRSKTNHHSV
jgi:hypothetical protein